MTTILCDTQIVAHRGRHRTGLLYSFSLSSLSLLPSLSPIFHRSFSADGSLWLNEPFFLPFFLPLSPSYYFFIDFFIYPKYTDSFLSVHLLQSGAIRGHLGSKLLGVIEITSCLVYKKIRSSSHLQRQVI